MNKSIPALLREGAEDDIWFDARDFGDEVKANQILATQIAMVAAAEALESDAASFAVNLKVALQQTDFRLLAKQKLSLAAKDADGVVAIPVEVADGLLHFLDAIMDAVVADKLSVESEVFPASVE